MPERSQYQLDRDKAQRHAFKQKRDLQAQKATSSIPGQVYHTMTSLADRMTRPGYTNTQADINQLKSLRRDWNRNQKYTPMGMQVSGVTTPGGAQDAFMNMSRALRQGNKPAYNQMYPITGKFMDVAEKGGIWGAMLSNFLGGKGKEIKKSIQSVGDRIGGGITNFIDDDKEKEEYAAKTFPFYPSDVHPGTSFYYDRPDDLEDFEDDPNAPIKRIQEEVYGGPRPHEGMPTFPDIYRGPRPHQGLPPLDVYEGPRPHEGIPLPLGTAPLEDVEISDLPDEPSRVLPDSVTNAIFEGNLPVDPRPTPNILDPDYLMWDHYYGDTHHPSGMSKGPLNVIPGIPDPVPLQDEKFDDYIERGEEPPAIMPYDDSAHEFGMGIGKFFKEMPESMKPDWEDYLEYVGRLGDMPGGKLTYDEWQRMMRRRR